MQCTQVPAGKGVMPGSFIDVLCQATHKPTGRPFTDIEIAQQANTALTYIAALCCKIDAPCACSGCLHDVLRYKSSAP